jgi:hypothetical protein
MGHKMVLRVPDVIYVMVASIVDWAWQSRGRGSRRHFKSTCLDVRSTESLFGSRRKAGISVPRPRVKVRAALPAEVENVQILTDDESAWGYHEREK